VSDSVDVPWKGGSRVRVEGKRRSAGWRASLDAAGLILNKPVAVRALAIPFAILAVVWMFAASACAQRFTFQNFAQRDGLRNLDFNCLLQESNGSLLVCTEFGLYRYDGSRFELVPTVEGSSSPLIQGIAQDLAGRLWISTPQSRLARTSASICTRHLR
jgi:hypothetical protein